MNRVSVIPHNVPKWFMHVSVLNLVLLKNDLSLGTIHKVKVGKSLRKNGRVGVSYYIGSWPMAIEYLYH